MKNNKHKKQAGKVLVDNYWIDEADAEAYIAKRAAAAERASKAMERFCAKVKLEWAGSEDGEAVVGFDAENNIRSVVHLDPKGIELIHSMDDAELLAYLK